MGIRGRRSIAGGLAWNKEEGMSGAELGKRSGAGIGAGRFISRRGERQTV